MAEERETQEWQEMCNKKQKVLKAPLRGPGVAELEKMMMLQEPHKKEDHNPFFEMLPSCLFDLPTPYSLPPPPNEASSPLNDADLPTPFSLPEHVQLTPNLDFQISNSLLALYGNGSSHLLGGGVHGTMTDQCPKLDARFTFPTKSSDFLLQQNSHHQWPTTMAEMDQQFIQLPSNQKPLWLQKENGAFDNVTSPLMGGLKRSWLPSVNNSKVSNNHNKVSSSFSGVHRHYQSSLEHNRTVASNATRGDQSDQKSEKCLPFDSNFLTLTPPNATLSLIQMKGRSIQKSYQRSGQSASLGQQPLCSLLLPKGYLGREETTLSLKAGRAQLEDDTLDLTLKL